MGEEIMLTTQDFEEQLNKIKELYVFDTNQELLVERIKIVFLMLAKTKNLLLKQKFELTIYNLYYDLYADKILSNNSSFEIDAFLQVIGLKTRDEFFKPEIDMKRLEMEKELLEEELKRKISRKK